MAKVQLAAEGDLGEMITLLAEEAAMVAGDRGTAFFYDYRGPTTNVAPYRLQLEAATRSLLKRAVNVRPGGAAFFSVDVVETGPQSASLVLQIVDMCLLPTESTVNLLMSRTQAGLVATNDELAEVRDLGAIKDNCERSGGVVSIGLVPDEGTLIRAEFQLNVDYLEVDHTAALEHGAAVWLLGKPPVVFESVIRRMHRLGWRVHLFSGVQEARDALANSDIKRPDVAIGAAHYNISLRDIVPFAEELAPSCAVYMTVLSPTRGRTDDLGFVDKVQIFVNPFSPAELYQITVRALAKIDKVLRLSVSPQKALSRRPRALLVEDNLPNQILSKEVLYLFGFEVDIANNGQEAMDYFGHETPALVIMDINMPVMDGLEATRRIRELERRGITPHIAIVAFTAQDSFESRANAKAAGMDGFVAKPINIASMQQEIARALETTPFELPEEIKRNSFNTG